MNTLRKSSGLSFLKDKKFIMCLIILCLCTVSMFAQGTSSTDANSGINNQVSRLVSFFSSGWVKGIACIALIAECIGLLLAGGQNPQILKKFLPFIAGTVIFMMAGKIVQLLMGDPTDFGGEMGLSALFPEENKSIQTDSFLYDSLNNTITVS